MLSFTKLRTPHLTMRAIQVVQIRAILTITEPVFVKVGCVQTNEGDKSTVLCSVFRKQQPLHCFPKISAAGQTELELRVLRNLCLSSVCIWFICAKKEFNKYVNSTKRVVPNFQTSYGTQLSAHWGE